MYQIISIALIKLMCNFGNRDKREKVEILLLSKFISAKI